MRVHVVKQGDSMTSIAEEYGFLWSTIWMHEKNSELRERRENPNILMAGDLVFIPDRRLKDESGQTGLRHIFRVTAIPARLDLRLVDERQRPRSGLRYSLTVQGMKYSDKTDADGRLSHIIPPRARKASLRLLDTGETWELDIGHVNPINFASGIQARLRNLGYYKGDLSGSIDDATRKAIGEYQSDRNLPVTGEADSPTRDALMGEHLS